MASDNLVEEARHLLNHPGWREPFGSDARRIVMALCDEVERLRRDNADLTAANISNLLSEIKERLTPGEGKQFEVLLMSATRGWVDEVTERSKVDRGLLEAFKDHPKRKKEQ